MPTEEEEPEREKESKMKHMIHLGLAEIGGRHIIRAKISWPPLSQLFYHPGFRGIYTANYTQSWLTIIAGYFLLLGVALVLGAGSLSRIQPISDRRIGENLLFTSSRLRATRVIACSWGSTRLKVVAHVYLTRPRGGTMALASSQATTAPHRKEY